MSRDAASTTPRVLLIDNFDSFTFNLVDAFAVLGARLDVYRNDIGATAALDLVERNDVDLIVLSPGPGTPQQAGCCIDLVRQAAGRVPLFGVCLGHQSIAAAFGSEVGPATQIMHGKKSAIRHNGHALFAGVDPEFDAGRYHSLAAIDVVPPITMIAACDGIAMAIAHDTHPLWGVQFHPESILTTHGQQLLANVLELALAHRTEAPACITN